MLTQTVCGLLVADLLSNVRSLISYVSRKVQPSGHLILDNAPASLVSSAYVDIWEYPVASGAIVVGSEFISQVPLVQSNCDSLCFVYL